jgi:hypothetical protein
MVNAFEGNKAVKDSIEARLAIVFAALAVGRWIMVAGADRSSPVQPDSCGR